MRIQHNIAALNSYRNLTNNNNAVSKNLEKLSSGYRINRAGDDAAGLAISEKMRAQITGLATAQKNANDGISLVQTAEGALTEVHSMLNRMVELADQSANGTYQDTDRDNLQKEMTALKDEINRISEATNFNGINLLDGSLGSTSGVDVAVDVKYTGLSTNPGVLALQGATAANSEFNVTLTDFNDGGSIELTVSDADGNLQKITANIAGSSMATIDEVTDGIQAALGDAFTVTNDSGTAITIQANEKGASNKFEVLAVKTFDKDGGAGTAVTGLTATKGADAYYKLNTENLLAYDGTGNAEDHIFEINGQKFAFATAEGAKKLDADVNYIQIANGGSDNKPIAAEVGNMVSLINNKTGIGAEADTLNIDLKAGTQAAGNGAGLTLQIGDTSDSFNQLTVSVGSMDTATLGIAGVDISTQAGAQKAVATIKSAIDMVSATRGDLGAIQNRLEHTINNLSVTEENMTAAESRIRDVDVAKEMMAYVKNNILVQSSQAMLAQANQLPQSVLQLLQ